MANYETLFTETLPCGARITAERDLGVQPFRRLVELTIEDGECFARDSSRDTGDEERDYDIDNLQIIVLGRSIPALIALFARLLPEPDLPYRLNDVINSLLEAYAQDEPGSGMVRGLLQALAVFVLDPKFRAIDPKTVEQAINAIKDAAEYAGRL